MLCLFSGILLFMFHFHGNEVSVLPTMSLHCVTTHHRGDSIILCAFYTDNILDDKPEVKSSADKEEQPVDEIPKRIKKSDNTTQSKGKVRTSSNGGSKALDYFNILKKEGRKVFFCQPHLTLWVSGKTQFKTLKCTLA